MRMPDATKWDRVTCEVLKPIPQIGALPGDFLFIRPGVDESHEHDDPAMALRREFYSEMVYAVPEGAVDVLIRTAKDGTRYWKDGRAISEDGEFVSAGQPLRLVTRGEDS